MLDWSRSRISKYPIYHRKMNKEEIERIIANKVSEKIDQCNRETSQRSKRLTIISMVFFSVLVILSVICSRYISYKQIERHRKQEDYIQSQLKDIERRLLERSSS